jgi:hypothetical protein
MWQICTHVLEEYAALFFFLPTLKMEAAVSSETIITHLPNYTASQQETAILTAKNAKYFSSNHFFFFQK